MAGNRTIGILEDLGNLRRSFRDEPTYGSAMIMRDQTRNAPDIDSDPFGVINRVRFLSAGEEGYDAARSRALPLYEPGTDAIVHHDTDGNATVVEPERPRTNKFFRRGETGGYTLTAKAWRNFFSGTGYGTSFKGPYTTVAHQETDPERRAYLFCKLLGVRFQKEAKLLKALMKDINAIQNRGNTYDDQGNIVISADNADGDGNIDPDSLAADRRRLQEAYQKIACGFSLEDDAGRNGWRKSNDRNHFDKTLHLEFLQAARAYIEKIPNIQINDDDLDEFSQNQEIRRRRWLMRLLQDAQEEEALNDGKRKRQKTPEKVAREMFCDEGVVTFGNNGAITIKVGDDFHFFGADPNGWAEGFGQMVRYLQDRGTDPWAALIACEGPAYFQEWFRAECRKQSVRWWPQYDEAFLVYGDLVPMVANQNIQMLAKGYWAEKVYMCDEQGNILMEQVRDASGNMVERARMTVIIMHDPEVCDAAGVPTPPTHLKNFRARAPKRHDESHVYQAFSYRQQASQLLRKVCIPLRDDGTSNDPVRAFDAARLNESQLFDLSEDERREHNRLLSIDEGYGDPDDPSRPRANKIDRPVMVNNTPRDPPGPNSKVRDPEWQNQFIADCRKAGVPDDIIQKQLNNILGGGSPTDGLQSSPNQPAPQTPPAKASDPQQSQPPPAKPEIQAPAMIEKPEHEHSVAEVVNQVTRSNGFAGLIKEITASKNEVLDRYESQGYAFEDIEGDRAEYLKTHAEDVKKMRGSVKQDSLVEAVGVLDEIMALQRNVDDSSLVTLAYADDKMLDGVISFSAHVDGILEEARYADDPSELDYPVTLNEPDAAARIALDQLLRIADIEKKNPNAVSEELSEIAERIALDLELYHEQKPAAVEEVIKKAIEEKPVLSSLLNEMKAGRGAFTKKDIGSSVRGPARNFFVPEV